MAKKSANEKDMRRRKSVAQQADVVVLVAALAAIRHALGPSRDVLL